MGQQTELSISYSLGIKSNLGNFSNADFHISREEKWDVSDNTPDEIEALYENRRAELKAQLDPIVEGEYREMLGIKEA